MSSNASVKGKNVFLSGPMSGLPFYNVAAFAEAHAKMRNAGAVRVYDPAIEYLRSEARNDAKMSHAYWMRRCINELTSSDQTNIFSDGGIAHYDVLVSLPGWEDSAGATLERNVALACGMRVYDLEEVS